MNYCYLCCLLPLLLLSCEAPSAEPEAPEAAASETFNPDAYLLEPVPGSSYQRAVRKNTDGSILEEGLLLDGKRSGTWVVYHPGSDVPKTIVSYADDEANGLYVELNDRGYLETRASYQNNRLHGSWAKYRFGRPTHEANYKDGALDGVYREYVMNTGKLQKEVTYKNGVMDGPYRFYNEEGVVTLEYEYRNGEKVGGGIVDPSRPNEPR